MYPNQPTSVPRPRGHNVPIVYRPQAYGVPPAPYLGGQHAMGAAPPAAPGQRQYDFARDRQTVEDLITRGYLARPTGDPVTAALTDQRDTSWLGLDDAIRQIRTRYTLYTRNMHGILYATAAALNALHTWKAEGWYHYSERQLTNQHRTLQDLYAQERQERISLWRDLARVRATLPEVVQQYLAAHRKLSLLDDVEGEVP